MSNDRIYQNGDKSLKARIKPDNAAIVELRLAGVDELKRFNVTEMRAFARWILAATEQRRTRNDRDRR